MKKNLITGITTAALLASCCGTAMAAPSVTVNNQPLTLEQPPVIVDSRTLVPMRAIFEALGCEVQWNADTQTVVAQKNLEYIFLTIGDNTLYADDRQITLDVPAQILKDRTIVPLRAVSEALHAEVSWDAATETVTITTPVDQSAYKYATQSFTETKGNVSVDMAYPQFYTRADADNTGIQTLNKQLAASARSRATAAETDLNDLVEGTEFSFTCTVQERYAMTYNKGDYVSILFQNVQDTHGAHPMTVRTGSVYNMKTGTALALTDILKGDQDTIDQLILDGFTAQIQQNPQAFYAEATEYLKEAVANHNYDFYLTDTGLTIFFQTYEIAPYAAGFQEYTIPFSQSDAFQIQF